MTTYSKEVVDKVKALYPDVTPLSRVVFIGFDPREETAFLVARHSIERRFPNIKVFPLYARALRQAGLYTREMKVEGPTGQFIDTLDGRPHSVEFSFTRFLVPEIGKILGLQTWALFIDCDFLVLDNLNTVWDTLETHFKDKKLACVKHDFVPSGSKKMDGVSQLAYNKKLWSALMFFNIPKIDLPSSKVNTLAGKELHTFSWLDEEPIGLSEGYQFIPGHSDVRVAKHDVNIVHYTEKAPWFKDEFYEDSYWGELWWRELEHLKEHIGKTPKYTKYWE